MMDITPHDAGDNTGVGSTGTSDRGDGIVNSCKNQTNNLSNGNSFEFNHPAVGDSGDGVSERKSSLDLEFNVKKEPPPGGYGQDIGQQFSSSNETTSDTQPAIKEELAFMHDSEEKMETESKINASIEQVQLQSDQNSTENISGHTVAVKNDSSKSPAPVLQEGEQPTRNSDEISENSRENLEDEKENLRENSFDKPEGNSSGMVKDSAENSAENSEENSSYKCGDA